MPLVTQHSTDPATCDPAPSAQLIGATDAVVRIDVATQCGADLHILRGAVPVFTDVRERGHEAVGTVIEVGPASTTVHVGDRLLVSCTSGRGHQRTLHHRCQLVVNTGGRPSASTAPLV